MQPGCRAAEGSPEATLRNNLQQPQRQQQNPATHRHSHGSAAPTLASWLLTPKALPARGRIPEPKPSARAVGRKGAPTLQARDRALCPPGHMALCLLPHRSGLEGRGTRPSLPGLFCDFKSDLARTLCPIFCKTVPLTRGTPNPTMGTLTELLCSDSSGRKFCGGPGSQAQTLVQVGQSGPSDPLLQFPLRPDRLTMLMGRPRPKREQAAKHGSESLVGTSWVTTHILALSRTPSHSGCWGPAQQQWVGRHTGLSQPLSPSPGGLCSYSSLCLQLLLHLSCPITTSCPQSHPEPTGAASSSFKLPECRLPGLARPLCRL